MKKADKITHTPQGAEWLCESSTGHDFFQIAEHGQYVMNTLPPPETKQPRLACRRCGKVIQLSA